MLKPDYRTMRKAMIDSQMRPSGVSAPWVNSAMMALPRENFVPKEHAAICYMDRSVPLGDGRAMHPPVTTGLMLQESEVSASDNVLLIGGGNGYVAALMAPRAKQITVLEESADLPTQAAAALKSLGNVAVVTGALNAGHDNAAPYSLIWIDGAIEQLPDRIKNQLAEGGRLICGTLDGPVSRLSMGIKRGGEIALRSFSDGEIRQLPGFAKTKAFVF